MRTPHLLAALVLSFSAISSAYASPITLSEGAFSSSDTVIDFNDISNEGSITNQYSSSGVTFSGALFGLTNPGDTNLFPSHTTIGTNWLYSQSSNQGTLLTLSFSSLQSEVGFYLENWETQSLTVSFFKDSTLLGSSVAKTSSLTSEFKGFQDLSGFNKVTLSNSSEVNGYFAIDDLKFGSTNKNSVSEPADVALLAIGLLGLFASRRKKQQ
jgi:hypothetical protein